jgi:hypothetical protein
MKIVKLGIIFLVSSSLSYASDSTTTESIIKHNDTMKKIEEQKKSKEEKFEGYSFFKTAMQHITYEERHVYKNDHANRGIKKGDVQTNDFSGTNLVTIGGNISPINDKYDFSFETVSTLIPQEINEKWTVGGVTNQTDKATIDFTQITLLVHQKYTPKHRAVGGIEFKKLAFERYDFGLANGDNAFPQLSDKEQTLVNIRERISSLSVNAGYWYESGNVGKKGWHYNAKALVKVPIWQNAENTSAPDISFSDPSGYDFDLELGASYTIVPNIDVGIIAGYNYIFRSGESKGSVHWPESTFKAYTLGLSFSWNL